MILMFLLYGCSSKEEPDMGEIIIRENKPRKAADGMILNEIYLDEDDYYTYMYFENTESIIQPDFLPVYILQNVTAESQKYLISKGYNNAEILYVIDNSAKHQSTFAIFDAEVIGYDKILTVKYSFITEELSFELN